MKVSNLMDRLNCVSTMTPACCQQYQSILAGLGLLNIGNMVEKDSWSISLTQLATSRGLSTLTTLQLHAR